MTAQQPFVVLHHTKDLELRHYPRAVVAEIDVTGSASRAGNAAFRPLVSYIGGHNKASSKMAMTAPVAQEVASEKLAMTAPVLQEAAESDRWTVSFVLPGDRPLSDYPEPLDPRVHLREIAAHDAAALRWSGRWSYSIVIDKQATLRAAITDNGWVASGEPRWARYDPPWKPPFLRRNEIIIPVDK
jgi:hypothetical protein